MRVLIIEDDAMIGRALATGLGQTGHHAAWVRDQAGAHAALAHAHYDMALLDLGLPGGDGLDLLRDLRQAGQQLPVLIITARDALADRVAGLDCGADDYLTKPFHLAELLARMRAVSRRRAGRSAPDVRYGALALDPQARVVRFRGAEVALSGREFALLETMMERPGALVTRERLISSLYGSVAEVRSNALEVHLHNLRRKLHPDLILTVRGAGYRLAPVE